jgi:membrane-associated phospholipid phosphatase
MPITDAPLLAPRRRAPAAFVVAVCTVVVALLGVQYANQSQPGGFDRAVDGWFLDHVNYRTALWFADLGNALVVLVCSIVIVVFAVWLRSVRAVLLAVLAPVASTSVTEYLVKPLVHRTKDGYLAYPSGHTTGWCTVAFVVVLLAAGPARQRLTQRTSRWIAAVAIVLAVGCMVGLVGSDYHYATDVIGGLGVAAATALGLALLTDELATATRDDPVPAESR